MKNTKKLLAILFAAVTLLSFTACNKNSAEKTLETLSMEDLFGETTIVPTEENEEDFYTEPVTYTGYSVDGLTIWGASGEFIDDGVTVDEYTSDFKYMLGTDGVLYDVETGTDAVRNAYNTEVTALGYKFYYDENDVYHKEKHDPYNNLIPEDHQVFYNVEIKAKDHVLVKAPDGSVYVQPLEGDNLQSYPLDLRFYNDEKELINFSKIDNVNYGEEYTDYQKYFYMEIEGKKYLHSYFVTYNHDATEFGMEIKLLDENIDRLFGYKKDKLYSKNGDNNNLYAMAISSTSLLGNATEVANPLPDGYTVDRISKVYFDKYIVIIFDDNTLYSGYYNSEKGTISLEKNSAATKLCQDGHFIDLSFTRSNEILIKADDNCIYKLNRY